MGVILSARPPLDGGHGISAAYDGDGSRIVGDRLARSLECPLRKWRKIETPMDRSTQWCWAEATAFREGFDGSADSDIEGHHIAGIGFRRVLGFLG